MLRVKWLAITLIALAAWFHDLKWLMVIVYFFVNDTISYFRPTVAIEWNGRCITATFSNRTNDEQILSSSVACKLSEGEYSKTIHLREKDLGGQHLPAHESKTFSSQSVVANNILTGDKDGTSTDKPFTAPTVTLTYCFRGEKEKQIIRKFPKRWWHKA